MRIKDMRENRWILTNPPTLSPENPPSGSSLPLFPKIYGIQESISHVVPTWALWFLSAQLRNPF